MGRSLVEQAAEVLRAGELVMIPTDTVYGIAAAPSVPGATQRLFDAKGRRRDIPIAVLVADADQAWSVARAPVPGAARRMGERWWPGALTVVVERDAAWTADLGDDVGTVGLRCPDHDFVRALCREVGPLATSSANRHGEPTAPRGDPRLPVGLVVSDGPHSGLASTVVDCTVDPPMVIREGAIPAAALLQ
jgi:tRNA threonylcarbamoyl adenosine modification protein (Sua5/YciO/YrdC/YwlC family)